MQKEYILENADETIAFGKWLGRQLVGGECIVLSGDLGAGKTTLTKGIAHGMGITETVHSPSYGIEAQYEATNGLRLHHFDFYRLEDPELLRYEFQDSLQDKNVVTIVEWADRLGDISRDVPRLDIEIEYLAKSVGRQLRCSGPLCSLLDNR